jgi:hypothetical protein
MKEQTETTIEWLFQINPENTADWETKKKCTTRNQAIYQLRSFEATNESGDDARVLEVEKTKTTRTIEQKNLFRENRAEKKKLKAEQEKKFCYVIQERHRMSNDWKSWPKRFDDLAYVSSKVEDLRKNSNEFVFRAVKETIIHEVV